MDSGLSRTVRGHVCIDQERALDCDGFGGGLGRGGPAVDKKHWD